METKDMEDAVKPDTNAAEENEDTLKQETEVSDDVQAEGVGEAESVTEAEEPAPEEEVSELDKVKFELEAMRDKYVRLFAEFDNYKRRSAKERLDYMKTAGQDILRDLLPVIDNMDRAEKSMESAKDVEAVKEGFFLIKDMLIKNLAAKGLKAMETIGKPFDSDFHEAITEIPAPNEELKGKVVDEVEKGYLLNEKIIRYAKVVVGK